MKKIATDKAQNRLDKARESLARVEASRNFAEFGSAWTDFLIATNSIHSILEQGAKSNPRSRQWYGGKKNERRKDALLSYLHQARNADEHGIEPITVLKPGQITLTSSGSIALQSLIINNDGTVAAEFVPYSEGAHPVVKAEPASAVLISVIDERFGNRFDPPTEHLGAALSDTSPMTVARAGLAYHVALVEEAGKLPE